MEIYKAADKYIFVCDPSWAENSPYHRIMQRIFSCGSDLIADYKYCLASGTVNADFCFTSKDGTQAAVIKLEGPDIIKKMHLDGQDKFTISFNTGKYQEHYAKLGVKSIRYYALFYSERIFCIKEVIPKKSKTCILLNE